MSAPLNSIPHETEEALTIPDKMMVFRSTQASSPTEVAKKVVLKSTKARFKLRKSTPAPPSKGNGWKRLVPLPFPEDKQLRKGIDFGGENSAIMEGSQCIRAISPTNPTHGLEDASNKMNHETRIICYDPQNDDGNLAKSGEVAGDGVAADRDEVSSLHQPRSKSDDPTNAKGIVVGEIVNFPKMNLETNLLLEGCLEPCHLGESHDALAVGDQLQPKKDNILLLAQLDSADMLDTMAAQPLLAGGQPKEDQNAAVPASKPSPTTGPPLLTIETTKLSSKETVTSMNAQYLCASGGPEDGQLSPEPRRTQMLVQAPATLNPMAACVPPYDDFPPLMTGTILKIRDTFEAGTLHHGSGSVWSRTASDGRASRGSGAPVLEMALMPPLGGQIADGSATSILAGQPEAGPSYVNKPNSPSQHQETHPEASAGPSNQTGSGGAENPGGQPNKPRSMAEMLRERPDPNGPQVFVPEKINNIGYTTT